MIFNLVHTFKSSQPMLNASMQCPPSNMPPFPPKLLIMHSSLHPRRRPSLIPRRRPTHWSRMSRWASPRHSPSLTRRHHHRPSTRMLRLYIRPRAQVLLKAADRTAHELVFVCRQRDDGHEAQSEEGPLRDAVRAPVAAVMALRRYAFVAFEAGGEICGDWLGSCATPEHGRFKERWAGE